MNKEKIKEKVIKDGKPVYLSAQEYDALSSDELESMREALEEEGIDPDDYETKTQQLRPKVFTPKPTVCRQR